MGIVVRGVPTAIRFAAKKGSKADVARVGANKINLAYFLRIQGQFSVLFAAWTADVVSSFFYLPQIVLRLWKRIKNARIRKRIVAKKKLHQQLHAFKTMILNRGDECSSAKVIKFSMHGWGVENIIKVNFANSKKSLKNKWHWNWLAFWFLNVLNAAAN